MKKKRPASGRFKQGQHLWLKILPSFLMEQQREINEKKKREEEGKKKPSQPLTDIYYMPRVMYFKGTKRNIRH